MNNSLKIRGAKKKNFITLSLLILTVLFSVILSGCSGENYGTKLNFGENNELYYTTNVKEEEAKALGDYLVKGEFFANDGNSRTTQLNKTGSTYEFRLVVKEGLDKDQDTIDLMKIIGADLSTYVFKDVPVDVHLCDDTLTTLRVVVFSPVDFGTKLTFGEGNELYYTTNVTEEEANALGDYLVKQDYFSKDSNGMTVQLNKTGSIYEFRMVIKEGLDKDQDTIDAMKTVGADLSKAVFNGETVDVHLCDNTLKTLRVVVY
ncbi:hypothetical protein [Clostridium sp.]|uniref:hypothetical protein n=1 Tax=Clostridium sp. TaxID=1506 RepID=UPI001A3A659E|nr:hypothetical protein [Clostridium sp.]MBK5236886.1 hypothetical protein [Clostridium sp.]